MQVAGPIDGGRILTALGVDTTWLRKAVITIELECAVTIQTERLMPPASEDGLTFISETYEVVRKEPKDNGDG